MKLLFDQNLPRRLVREVETDFPGSAHVRDFQLDTAIDPAIFAYAAENGFAIVSKDNDFAQLSFLRGAPPKVIWLRVGNSSTEELRKFIQSNTRVIQEFDSASESFLILEPSEA